MRHTAAKCWITGILAVGLVASTVRPGVAADAPKPAAAPASNDPNANDPVEVAIRKAVAYLYKTQKGDNWEQSPRRTGDEPAQVTGVQWGGLTAMATYGLLAAGESPQNPQVAKAIDWLTKADVIGTYAMGMKLQIWNYVEHMTQGQKDSLRKDATLLLNGVKVNGVAKGLYHYWTDPTKGNYDHSTSNYGVLGMWAAAQQNLEIPVQYWELVDAAWRKNQAKDGGWAYVKEADAKHPTSISLTPAGVATLFITQEMIGQTKAPGECKGNIPDPNIERGLKWISDNYKTLGGNLYAMYNIERTGTASGLKYFGTIDWYKAGAAHLVRTQKPDGSWEGHGSIPGTVWGILFLVKGRAPVMMNKLEYAMDGGGADKGVANWNQRPRDMANLARWTGKQLEKDLNWQIVNLRVDIEDLHDAPVLYVAGNQAVNLSKQDKDKLKQFVEGGGLILGHADCNDTKFSTSFQKLGHELFKFGEFRDLPPDHLIYNVHFSKKNWGNFVPNLRGLSNGAREVMLLLPAGDPARYWQIQNFSGNQTRPMAELATNIYLYAADKASLRSKFKGQTYIVKRSPQVKDVRELKVARLEYSGTWDPEPGAWRRMSNVLHNNRGINASVETVALGEGKLKFDSYKLAHLTGTTKFKLTPEQRKELKAYIDGGGTLVVDAAGGSAEFKEAAEAELQQVFGDAAKGLAAPLPPGHKVYSIGGDGLLANVAYRAFARTLMGSGMKAPRLRGIEVNNRTVCLYSPEDLTVGLVGNSIDGIYGYEPAYASQIMENIVMMASGGPTPKVVAATKPAEAAKPAEGEKKMEGPKKKEEPKKKDEPKKDEPKKKDDKK